MVDQVADGDGRAEVREFRHVLADVVVQRHLAVTGEEMDGRRRELLGYRRDVEHRRGGEDDVVVEVRHAVCAGVDEAAVAHQSKGATRRRGLVHPFEDLVDLGREL